MRPAPSCNPPVNLDLAFTLGLIENRLCKLEAKLKDGPETGTGKVAFMANTGSVNARQAQVSGLVNLWNPTVAFMAGGGWTGAGGSAGLEASYAAFNFLSASDRLYPALGDDDVANDPLGAVTVERFKHVNGGGRFYSVEFPDLDMEVFVLNTSAVTGVSPEPFGVDVGSDQHKWFIGALKASSRKWRVVVSASPYAVADNTVPDLSPETDWAFESLGVHLIISSSVAPAAHIRRGASHLVHIGADGVEAGHSALSGSTVGTFLVWRDPDGGASPSAALLTVTPERLWLDITDAATSETLHSICIQ